MTKDSNYYVARFFYNLLYFICVIVILLSIVFGVIIDTFAELRDKDRKNELDKKNICYICGASKDNLEKENINFTVHTTTDHFMWTYVEYIIGLKFIDPQEANAVNSYVIDNLNSKSISWFPVHMVGGDDEHGEHGGHGSAHGGHGGHGGHGAEHAAHGGGEHKEHH
jgi:hypothetical protein